MPATAENSFTPTKASQSIAIFGKLDGGSDSTGGGSGRGGRGRGGGGGSEVSAFCLKRRHRRRHRRPLSGGMQRFGLRWRRRRPLGAASRPAALQRLVPRRGLHLLRAWPSGARIGFAPRRRCTRRSSSLSVCSSSCCRATSLSSVAMRVRRRRTSGMPIRTSIQSRNIERSLSCAGTRVAGPVIGIGCFGRYKDATEWLGRGESDSHAPA